MAADTETAPSPPPHLRAASSDDTGGECETCTYFDHMHCTAYPPLCVDSQWVCDHWKKGSASDTDAQPKTMDEAGAEARRRLRAAK